MLNIQTLTDVPVPSQIQSVDEIAFGKTFTPNCLMMEYRAGEWQNARIETVGALNIHPAAVVFHYGQGLFEGMKAFRQADGRISIFRPDMNARRLNISASRLQMPMIDEEFFIEASRRLVEHERHYVPKRPGSLYLRPTLFGSEPCIRVRSATEFLFYILALPAGPYFRPADTESGSVDVLVSKKVARAFPGGLGDVKAIGNYAGTLQILADAKTVGCDQVLFLDALTRTKVEEMGGMNVFILRNGTLLTPRLTGSILAGITRDSVITLARDLGIMVEETTIDIDDVVRDAKSGAITEVMASGTAAVLTSIATLRFEDGAVVRIGSGGTGPVARKLLEQLVGIQYGDLPDRHNWVFEVCAATSGT